MLSNHRNHVRAKFANFEKLLQNWQTDYKKDNDKMKENFNSFESTYQKSFGAFENKINYELQQFSKTYASLSDAKKLLPKKNFRMN